MLFLEKGGETEMWRSKKFIMVTLLVAVVLVGSIGGVALAQTENGDDSQPKTLLARVAEILSIDQQELEDAFAEARSEMQAEALDSRLQYLVDQDEITQDEADQYKAWMESRPDVSVGFGFKGHGGFRGMHGIRGFGSPCAP